MKRRLPWHDADDAGGRVGVSAGLPASMAGPTAAAHAGAVCRTWFTSLEIEPASGRPVGEGEHRGRSIFAGVACTVSTSRHGKA